MRILKLAVLVLACLGGSQVAAGPPMQASDSNGAMMLARGGFGGHSHGFHHRSSHSGFRLHQHHHHHHGFMGHHHQFNGFHRNHDFRMNNSQFMRFHHHRFDRHIQQRGVVIRFNDPNTVIFTSPGLRTH